MKIEKITIAYNYKELKTNLLKHTDNEKGIDLLIDFLSENIRYGAFSSRNLIGSFSFDYTITNGLILELEKELAGEKLLSNKAQEVMNDFVGFGINVDEDYDTDEFHLNTESILEDFEVQLYPTFPIFEEYSEKIEEIFKDQENFKDNEWSLYESVEDFEKKYRYAFLKHETYQYGGNQVFTTQRGYTDFIGSYYGEYGDAGTVYVYAANGTLCSTVDMF